MRRILGSPAFLLGLAIVPLFASGCGADEGSRCQIDSDCASGLICENRATGNGTCKPSNARGNPSADAAVKQDANLSSGPEVEPAPDAESPVEAEPAVDLGPPVDAVPAADGGESAVVTDAIGSVDSQTIDSL